MRRWTDEQLVRVAFTLLSVGFATIGSAVLMLAVPWYVAVLPLLPFVFPRLRRVVGSEREDERVRRLYRRTR